LSRSPGNGRASSTSGRVRRRWDDSSRSTRSPTPSPSSLARTLRESLDRPCWSMVAPRCVESHPAREARKVRRTRIHVVKEGNALFSPPRVRHVAAISLGDGRSWTALSQGSIREEPFLARGGNGRRRHMTILSAGTHRLHRMLRTAHSRRFEEWTRK